MQHENATRTPRHVWLVGILSLLWSAGGAYDYVMINLRKPDYLEHIGGGAELMQAIDAMPYSVMAAWAIGMWGAVAGSLLLVLRSRHCVPAFGLSLLGLGVITFWLAAGGLPEEMKSVKTIAMNFAIWAVAVLLLVYCIRMRRQRALR